MKKRWSNSPWCTQRRQRNICEGQFSIKQTKRPFSSQLLLAKAASLSGCFHYSPFGYSSLECFKHSNSCCQTIHGCQWKREGMNRIELYLFYFNSSPLLGFSGVKTGITLVLETYWWSSWSIQTLHIAKFSMESSFILQTLIQNKGMTTNNR